MPRPSSYRAAWVLASSLLFFAPPSSARAPIRLAVSADGQCPRAERVQRQLEPLLSETTILVGPRLETETASVADRGQEFSVKVRHVERVIRDPARDCEERARIAAVFIALVVDPPLPPTRDSGATEPPPSPHPVARPEPPPKAPAPVVATMAGVTAAWAPGRDGRRPWGVGPVLRFLVGRPAWDVSLAAAFVSPAELDLKRGAVRLTRVPFDLSGSLVFGGFRLRGVVGAGVAGDLLHLAGADLARARSTVRLDVGLRSHLGLRVLLGSGIWGVAETSATFFPRPYEFEVPPSGVVGQTPSVWLAASVGALFEIR